MFKWLMSGTGMANAPWCRPGLALLVAIHPSHHPESRT